MVKQLRRRHLPVVLAWGLLSAGGCAQVDSRPRIQEAQALVEGQLGQAPDWQSPWDSAPPEWSTGGVLELDEAIARTLRNNRALRADVALIGQADAELVQAGLLQNPVFNLMVMFPDGGGRPMLQSNAGPMQALQDLWLIPAREDAARARLRETLLRVADRAVEQATDVRRLYARLQFTQRARELMHENIELADQSAEVIEMRQVAGRATQVESNLARIRALRLRSDLIALDADFRSLQRELLLAMGCPGASDNWTVVPIHELLFDVEVVGEEADLLTTGGARRLDLLAAEWTLKGAEREVEVARRGAWPDVAVGLAFQRAGRGRGPSDLSAPARVGNAAAQALTNRAFGVDGMPGAPTVNPWQPSFNESKWMVGPMFDIEIPIFDQNQAQIARAIHVYAQRLAEYDDRAQEVTRGIRESLVRYRQAAEQIEFYRGSVVPEVDRNLDLAQQSFVAGEESLTVYLGAQEDVIGTRLRVLEFVRDALISRADLARAVGGTLPEPHEDDDHQDADAATSTPATASGTEVIHEY